MIKQTPHMKPPMHKQKLQQRNRFGMVSRNTADGRGRGLKLVLLARNLPLILMQHILVCIGVHHLIFVTTQRNTYNQNHKHDQNELLEIRRGLEKFA